MRSNRAGGQGAASGEDYALVQESPVHQHGTASEDKAGDIECPCCGDCVVACVLSGCNPAAAAFATVESNYDEPNRYISFVTFSHDEPILYPPFRPPIHHV